MIFRKTSENFLKKLDGIHEGYLNVELPNGKSYEFGRESREKPVQLIRGLLKTIRLGNGIRMTSRPYLK